MKIELSRTFHFEAAHFLPQVPEGHKCKRVHGHSYVVTVALFGEIDPQLGWLMDFAEVDRVVDPIIKQIDHQLLNDVSGLENPTSELLAVWLWKKLDGKLPHLRTISVAETKDSFCTIAAQ